MEASVTWHRVFPGMMIRTPAEQADSLTKVRAIMSAEGWAFNNETVATLGNRSVELIKRYTDGKDLFILLHKAGKWHGGHAVARITEKRDYPDAT
jgi:hypothetical protein